MSNICIIKVRDNINLDNKPDFKKGEKLWLAGYAMHVDTQLRQRHPQMFVLHVKKIVRLWIILAIHPIVQVAQMIQGSRESSHSILIFVQESGG